MVCEDVLGPAKGRLVERITSGSGVENKKISMEEGTELRVEGSIGVRWRHQVTPGR